MPNLVTTARGEVIDFDALMIKQQLANAPMNIEVERRKDFIDSKESRTRGKKTVEQKETIEEDFNAIEPVSQRETIEPIQNLPNRKK